MLASAQYFFESLLFYALSTRIPFANNALSRAPQASTADCRRHDPCKG